jgi:MSHA biogenesis protein MshP
MRTPASKIRGFAIVSAIFILVVLAALGAFILSISTSQQIGSALDVQGARAYHAARTGIEWGLYRQLRDGSCPGAGSPTSFAPTATTLSGFTITVTCVAVPDPGAHGGPTTYRLQSTACTEPNAAEPRCPNTTNAGNRYIDRRLDAVF